MPCPQDPTLPDPIDLAHCRGQSKISLGKVINVGHVLRAMPPGQANDHFLVRDGLEEDAVLSDDLAKLSDLTAVFASFLKGDVIPEIKQPEVFRAAGRMLKSEDVLEQLCRVKVRKPRVFRADVLA